MTAPGLNSTLNGSDPVKVYDLYAGWSGVMVLSMSMAGSSADADYNARMRECASGAFDGYLRVVWVFSATNNTTKGGDFRAVPEWSMDRGQYGAGDRPGFVDMMFNFFKDNSDILAFENIFNNGRSGAWNYYPESAANAQSAARYTALWKQ